MVLKIDLAKNEPNHSAKIRFIILKANSSYLLLLFYLFFITNCIAQSTKLKQLPTSFSKDSIVKDSIKKTKEVLDFIVTHNAKDYTIQNAKKQTVTLYNQAHITYNDIDLKAGKIIIDYKNNTVYATGIKDSTKTNYIQKPIFKQGQQESEQDSIIFNFKSKKAIVYGAKTLQGEMIVYGDKSKRINDSTIYMRGLRFTTSKKKIPDYYIATDKAKLVPNKKIIVGGSNMVIADVPTPLYLPFAYYPLTKKRSSGFLLPSWGENNQQGFFLQNGGYYFVVNDYFDLELTGDLYSNGSWSFNSRSNYYVRYKYSGNLSFRYQNLINEIRGFTNYSKSTNYNIQWSHSQDSKSSPNSRISASVNLGSSKFYRESFNEVDANQYLTNTFSSSINYYKKFVGTPFNMSTSITHSQNSNTEEINMSLPSFQLNMERQYPFQGKGGIKKTPIQKIGINYSLKADYRIKTKDEYFLKSKMFNQAKSGVQHNVSAGTNIKAFKYFTLSPNASYKDVWYFEKIKKRYNPLALNKNGFFGDAVNDTISGFNRFGDLNVSASLSTNIYGTFNFKKGRLKAIRHTIRPSISWSYHPNIGKQYYKKVRNSANPDDLLTYSPFEGGMYGTPSNGLYNAINISVNNSLEAKVTPKEEDDKEEDKKINILNNLNLSTSYNFAADSLRWSNLRLSTGTSFFNNKLGVNLSGSFDPYQVTQKGIRIDKTNSYLLRLNNANLTANYSISSEDLKKDKNKKDKDVNNTDDVYRANIGGKTNDFVNSPTNKKTPENKEKVAELYNANIPWDISFNYGASYNNNGYSKSEINSHTLGFSGNIELTPKWKVGFASGYDFVNKGFSYTRLNFSRDLDSWRFNFNWIPFGDRTSYYFFIGIKSSTLSDLKWDKNQPPDKRLY